MQSSEIDQILVLFHKGANKPNLLNQQFMEKIAKMKSVYLYNGTWRMYNLPQASESIKQWQLDAFRARNNFHPRILKQIENISFPYLICIDVCDNGINSVEGLERAMMPVLQELQIGRNLITRLNSIRKMNLPNLTLLGTNNNMVLENNCINEMHFNKYLKSLELTNYFCMAWIVKLEPQKLEFLYEDFHIWTQQRPKMKQLSLYRKLSIKYHNLRVYN